MERKWQNLLVIIFYQEILTVKILFLAKLFSISSSLFFMLQTHYRSILDFSDDTIVAAEKGYKRNGIIDTLKSLNVVVHPVRYQSKAQLL
jgi:cysteinyl-tRNA synthetase